MHNLHLMSGLVLALAAEGLPAQPPGHGSHPPMPDQQFVLRCQLDGGDRPLVLEAPLRLESPLAPADLSQVVDLPEPLAPLRLTRYLPRAVLEQQVSAGTGPETRSAVEISIEGPTQSTLRWLLAGDPARDRLLSFIGTWRYMAVADRAPRDDLFAQFAGELTREPRLRVRRKDAPAVTEMPATAGAIHKLEDPECRLEVREFMPHFGVDDKTKRPTNQSDKRLNPAALVRIECGSRTEERWVFVNFPDFREKTDETLPLEITLDCPLAKESPTPDFMVVTIGGADHEAWTRLNGQTTSQALALDQKVDIAGSQYTFRLTRFFAAGRLREQYRPTEDRGGVSALRVEMADAAGAQSGYWLEMGKPFTMATSRGPLTLEFGLRRAEAKGAHP